MGQVFNVSMYSYVATFCALAKQKNIMVTNGFFLDNSFFLTEVANWFLPFCRSFNIRYFKPLGHNLQWRWHKMQSLPLMTPKGGLLGKNRLWRLGTLLTLLSVKYFATLWLSFDHEKWCNRQMIIVFLTSFSRAQGKSSAAAAGLEIHNLLLIPSGYGKLLPATLHR